MTGADIFDIARDGIVNEQAVLDGLNGGQLHAYVCDFPSTLLRQHPRFQKTPILILTTESSDQMKQAGRAAGATGWLVKPFDPAKLIEVIGKVIR